MKNDNLLKTKTIGPLNLAFQRIVNPSNLNNLIDGCPYLISTSNCCSTLNKLQTVNIQLSTNYPISTVVVYLQNENIGKNNNNSSFFILYTVYIYTFSSFI